MKHLLAAALLSCACAGTLAQTNEELLNPSKNFDNVLNLGTGYDLKMFSPLKQINKSNVKRLVPVWHFSTASDMGELSQPTVYIGVIQPMMVNGVLISGTAGGDRTARGFVDGYDPETGKRLWRTYTIPAPGEKSSETWPHKALPDAWKYGDAATWQSGSYDPELDWYIETSFKDPSKGEPVAYSIAVNPVSGKVAWKQPIYDFGISAGTLATDGGLLFTGRLTGEVVALDQDTGKPLWQFKTGSSVNAPPITYTHKGQQYVTILSGRGGSNPNRSAGSIVPSGGSVWTFALMTE